MNEADFDLLILGLGNVLCGDDGAGVAAIEVLQRDYVVPSTARVLDGGTLGLSLLPYLESARQVILVDAIAADAPAGTIVELAGQEVARASLKRLSPHQIGVADLLTGALLSGSMPPQLRLLGIVPEGTELGLGLSSQVRAGVPELVERVVQAARALGHTLSPRAAAEPRRGAERSEVCVARLLGV